MIPYERPIRFDDVDAAGIVFFGRYAAFCHEAMEAFFDAVEGGYAYLASWDGGLRIVDVADPFAPEEIGHFIPEPVGDEPCPQSNNRGAQNHDHVQAWCQDTRVLLQKARLLAVLKLARTLVQRNGDHAVLV